MHFLNRPLSFTVASLLMALAPAHALESATGKVILNILGKVVETNSPKGPLFIVYPYDSKPELSNQTHYDRSAWQLQRMEIE